MNTALTFIIGIIGLGILVLIHETGHFIVARICGVKVESFSVGMGPVILHKTIKGTDYRLSLIPLGGYCGMKGEKDYQNALENHLKTIEAEPDSFYGIHPLKRLCIAFAGPFFNYLFGVLAFTIIALVGYTYYTSGPTVQMADEVYEDVFSPAHQAGMQTGDTITAFNNTPVTDFSEISQYIAFHGDEDILVSFIRDGKEMQITVHTLLDKETGTGKLGIKIMPDSIIEKEYPARAFFPALGEGFVSAHKMLASSIQSFSILFKGVKLTNVVSGPARISNMLGETVTQGFKDGAKTGIVSTFEFLALISLALFITNLLPVPIFDGGLIIVALIETILRKKISPKVLLTINYIGLAFIAVILFIAFIGDGKYFFTLFNAK